MIGRHVPRYKRSYVFNLFNIIKSSSDALDGPLGPDRRVVVEAKLNSSFQKD